jgi:enoyl-CoA hydratase/carnithine racemase
VTKFADYKDRYETVALQRSKNGILEMRLHSNGGPYVWDFHGIVRDRKANRGGTHAELADCFGQVAHDPDNRVVIMTGTGDVFSGPPNTQEGYPRGDADYWDVLRSTATQLIMNLLDIEAPMIACLNGPASRHAELPFGADIVLAAEDAWIQDSSHFPNRQPPGDAIAIILPFLMGWNRGRYWLYMGQELSAREMKECGLVSEVLPREKLLPRAWEIAEHLAKSSPLVLRYTRLMTTAPIKALVQQYFGYSFALEALACIQESGGKVPGGFKWDD